MFTTKVDASETRRSDEFILTHVCNKFVHSETFQVSFGVSLLSQQKLEIGKVQENVCRRLHAPSRWRFLITADIRIIIIHRRI